ncbi:hypothetical protein [Mycobacteroides chelonae]|uniref:hypothetical protein n=1 Tax=Mycobacteroides chelonae TaxID=1774 RepID=UPI001F478F52|nr:hypothetical protein [Mycobacteroides chelonae]
MTERNWWSRFLAASWYWLNGGPRHGQINGFADAGDILAVSRCVNGWVETPNGMPDRTSRYNRALAMGDALLTLTNGDDDMFTDDDRDLLRQIADIRRPSLSPLRHLGEGTVNTCAGFAWSADGLTHPQFVAMAARVGHTESIELLAEVAGADPVKYPDRQGDANLARAILADLEANHPEALRNYLAQNGARS